MTPQIKLPAALELEYQRWSDFLHHEVHFAWEGSEAHTAEHCARVLLIALLLSQQLELEPQLRAVLALACVFHDSRRHDDGLDVGHGQRAADYYREYCQAHELTCDKRAYLIMAYHDRNDALGEAELMELPSGVLLYHLFKDADALDRLRFGPFDLDVRYLRTEAARTLYPQVRSWWLPLWRTAWPQINWDEG